MNFGGPGMRGGGGKVEGRLFGLRGVWGAATAHGLCKEQRTAGGKGNFVDEGMLVRRGSAEVLEGRS